jgi:hypothetical protein
LNPKSEVQNPKEIRSPKPERADSLRRGIALFRTPAEGGSDFGLLSDFADSDFGFRVEAAAIFRASTLQLFNDLTNHKSVMGLWRGTSSFMMAQAIK